VDLEQSGVVRNLEISEEASASSASMVVTPLGMVSCSWGAMRSMMRLDRGCWECYDLVMIWLCWTGAIRECYGEFMLDLDGGYY
jgi:hypothetical protein